MDYCIYLRDELVAEDFYSREEAEYYVDHHRSAGGMWEGVRRGDIKIKRRSAKGQI